MAEEPEAQDPTSSSSSSSHSLNEILKNQRQVPFCVLPSPNGDVQMVPVLNPAFLPGFFQVQQNQEQINHGRGLYAVQPFPSMGSTAGYPLNSLIPFTYNLPTGPSASEARAVGADNVHLDQQQQQQQQHQLQPGAQRQVVVRRFQIAFQLDLLLILKLVAVIFLFNQDGSRQRLVLLVFFASLIYLYQTGALAPLVRWLSQGMQRADLPPRAAARAGNVHAAGRAENDNAAPAEGQLGGENENQPADGNRAADNEPIIEPGEAEGGNRWWVLVKEIQMIVFGFITSLLPGFHNID